MVRAEVLTPWIEVPAPTGGTERRAAVAVDYMVARTEDVTGQPAENLVPDPNLCSVVVVCTGSVFDGIAADPRYAVLWSETL